MIRSIRFLRLIFTSENIGSISNRTLPGVGLLVETSPWFPAKGTRRGFNNSGLAPPPKKKERRSSKYPLLLEYAWQSLFFPPCKMHQLFVGSYKHAGIWSMGHQQEVGPTLPTRPQGERVSDFECTRSMRKEGSAIHHTDLFSDTPLEVSFEKTPWAKRKKTLHRKPGLKPPGCKQI